MSGVEIVGFLLGSLPLAISACEHYREGLDPLKDYLRYDRTLKTLHTRLRLQQALYEGTLQRLLLSELSEAQTNALFQGLEYLVDTKLWGTKEIEEKVHRKLGGQYKTFMDVIGEMEGVMRKLMYKLDIDIQWKSESNDILSASSQNRKRLEWEWRRIRRSFGRREREDLIQNFERYNANIAAYVEQREILAPLSERRPESSLAHLDFVRDQACGLYEALKEGWRCNCLDAHSANLQLGRRETAKEFPSFKISFSFQKRLGHSQQCQEAWQETQIDISEMAAEQARAFASDNERGNTAQVQMSSNIPAINIIADTVSADKNISSSNTKSRKTVRVLDPSDNSLAKDQTFHPTNPEQEFEIQSPISCLCQAIQTAQTHPTYLGFLSDRSRKRNITITTTAAQSSLATPVRLESLLSPKTAAAQQPIKLGKLSRQQRLQIAVTLASTVLQLHKSPWLNENWSKRDIYFFCSGLDSDKRPLISDGYVSRSFMPPGRRQAIKKSADAVAEDFLSSQIINKTLFALGIVLIELCLNKTFENLHAALNDQQEEVSPQGIADVYQTAISHIDAVYSKGGTQYGYVVQRCLKCEFGVQDSQKQLDFDAFRGLVYEGVVAPLEEDLKKYSLYRG